MSCRGTNLGFPPDTHLKSGYLMGLFPCVYSLREMTDSTKIDREEQVQVLSSRAKEPSLGPITVHTESPVGIVEVWKEV